MHQQVDIAIVNPLMAFLRRSDPSMVPARLRLLFDPEHMDDDTLDVSLFFPYAPAKECVLHFHMLPPSVSDAARIYARLATFIGKAPSTVQGHIRRLAALFNEAQRRYGLWNYCQLTYNQLEAIVNDSLKSASEKMKTCTTAKSLFMYMNSFCGEIMSDMDLSALDSLRGYWQSIDMALSETGKTPDIAPEYFSALEEILPLMVVDKSLPLGVRLVAGIFLLEMRVGLRKSELLTLTVNSHIVKKATNGRETDYLVYSVKKLSGGGQTQVWAECYMLPSAVSAFELMLELRKEVPGHEKTDRLFLMPDQAEFSLSSYKYQTEKLFTRYLKSLSTSRWEDISRRQIDGETYYIPTATQFRVHLCGYLYRQGIRLDVIEIGMSHLTNDMIAYYYRVKDRTFRMHQQRADNVILTHIDNDYALDGSGHKGDELLSALLFYLESFRVYASRLDQMIAKDYGYEIDRYTKLCRSRIFSELRPSLSYLSRLLESEGREAVLRSYPSLKRIVDDIESIKNELTTWERNHKI